MNITTTINPQVYIDAAITIFNWDSYESYDSMDKYCCNLLDDDYRELFEKYFKPKKLPKNHFHTGWWGRASVKTDEQRILALLFMRLIAEDLNKE